MFGFLDPVVSLAYHLVTGLTQLLTPVAGVSAAAAAIVVFTLAVRVVLLPLSYYALRGQARQARLQPQLAELRQRYAGQPERLNRELAEFYQREGGGLLIGCLPLLAQLPFFSAMYRLFLSSSVGGHPNALLTHRLLGVPLGAHWLSAGLVSPHGLVFALLLALLAVVCWLSARLARRTAAAAAAATGAASPDRASAWLGWVLPFTTVIIAAFVPLAAGIYLLVAASCTLAERATLGRLGASAD
jgi:YidC/Oxa1 family membrane protein insertase